MTQRELTPADYMAMFRRRWVMIAVLTVIGGPLAFALAVVLPAKYKSQTTVLVQPPAVSADIVKPVDTTDLGQRLSSMQQQILSRSRLEPIIREFGLFPKDIDRKPMEELVARLQKAIEVSPIQPMAETQARNLPGFFVAVTLGDARTAQQVCSAVTSLFIEESLRIHTRNAEDATEFLTQRLADAKANLDEQDRKLAAFKSAHIGELPDEEQTNMSLLTTLTTQLDAATQALERAQQDKSFAQSMLTQQVSTWQAAQGGHDPETLETQLAALQSQLTTLQSKYTDDHPDVIKAKNDIAALQQRIAENQSTKSGGEPKSTRTSIEPVSITQLRAQIHNFDSIIAEKTKDQEQIRHQIATYQARIQSTPMVEQQYTELTRGYKTAQDYYSDLLKKREDASMATRLAQAQEGEQFSVLDPANLPDKPSFPNRLFFVAGGFGGGLALGLGIALLLEMKDTSLRTERDVEFALRLPMLAMIPAIDPLAATKGRPRLGPAPPAQLTQASRS
jgi:protein tyrosine kinase modulator